MAEEEKSGVGEFFLFHWARHAPLHIYAPLHRLYSPGKGAEGIGSEKKTRDRTAAHPCGWSWW
jgi:hypothetical protein